MEIDGGPPHAFDAYRVKTESITMNLDTVFDDDNDAIDTTARPDIEWIPSRKTYEDRVKRLQERNTPRATAVPDGWPAQVEAARVWSGADFNNADDYVVQLSNADVAKLEAGLARFKSLPGELDPDNVSRESFPLSAQLAAKLEDVSKTVHHGRGFAVLRGLAPQNYTLLDNILIYLGVTSHIAEIRGCQDYDGRMIVHIKDIQDDLKKYGIRGPFSPYTSRAQPFHTDRCDILSLYAYDVPPVGGESLLASGGRIYNEIAAKRPDIIHELVKEDWVFDEFHHGQYHRRALLHNFPGNGPGFVYSRRPLTGAHFSPHYPGVPAMSEEQAEALDAVHFTAREHALEIKLQRGDIEIINNFALFHARAGFVDDASGRRHLIRLWLRSEKHKWETPRAIEQSSWEIYGNSEFRENQIWDIDKSPPKTRGRFRRMSCN